MNRTPRISALALALLVPLAARADDAKPPIRHLEFDAHVSVTSMSTSEGYNSFGSGVNQEGLNEHISVDVLAVANDGGLVVRTQAQAEGDARPEEPVECAVYGDGRVACAPHAHVTDDTMLLLSTLGRGWYDPSIVTNGTWTRKLDFQTMTLKSTYKRQTPDGTDPMRVTEHTDLVNKGDIHAGSTSDTNITYNVALSVPLSIHDEEVPKSGQMGTRVTTDIKLTKDSMAKQ